MASGTIRQMAAEGPNVRLPRLTPVGIGINRSSVGYNIRTHRWRVSVCGEPASASLPAQRSLNTGSGLLKYAESVAPRRR